MNDKIKSLQEKLNQNMDKAVKLAEKNCIRNENGEVVFTKDEIDEMEDIDIISDNVKQSLKEQLKDALIEFSYGQVSESKAEEISEKAINRIDLTNSALNHKGMNWLAREILNMMGINTYKVVGKETARKAMDDCTKKYNKALKNLADK